MRIGIHFLSSLSLPYVDRGRLNLPIETSVQHQHLNAFAYASDADPGHSANRISAFFKLQLRPWIVERLSNSTDLLA
jgi:hypothetical protein